MYFASSHVLNYDESDDEVIYEEELEEDLRDRGTDLLGIEDDDEYCKLKTKVPTAFAQANMTYEHNLEPASMPSYGAPLPPVRRGISVEGTPRGMGAAGGGLYDNRSPANHTRAPETASYDNMTPLPTGAAPSKPPRRKKLAKSETKVAGAEPDGEPGDYANPYDVPRTENTYASIGEVTGQPPPPPPLPRRPASQPPQPPAGKQHRHRKADTNVISVKFDTLVKPSHMHTGEVMNCEGCGAVLSSLSTLTDSGDGGKIWKCEFCDHINRADLDDEEIPKKQDVTYMMRPAPSTVDPAGYFGDDSNIIFCMDVSGSMCVTTEVPGVFPLRANDSTSALELYKTTLNEDQYMPYQRRDVTYVSRLQAMQSAVDHNLGKLLKDCSTKRIGLVTFNNEVTVISDGVEQPVTVTGDRLYDKEGLISLGSQLPVPRFIRDTRKILGDKIFSLEECGQTALGPALLISVAMASQKPGSKVIICTDGKANVGLGTLEEQESDMAYDCAAAFYEGLGNYAKEKCVSVSVLTLEGTDCRMVELGNVSDKTGGQVSIVDPLKLKDEFGEILNDPVIATNVTAKLQLHRGLYFRNEEAVQNESQATRNIGNVTADTEITFEFGVRKRGDVQRQGQEVLYDNRGGMQVQAEGGVDEPFYDIPSESVAAAQQSALTGLDRLPFQLTITYTSRDEAQCLRVITQDRPITNDRDLVIENLNAPVYSAHTAQTTANLAMQGEYTAARLNAVCHHKLMKKHAYQKQERGAYDAFVFNIAPMAQDIGEAQSSERSRGQNLSDDEEDYDALSSLAKSPGYPSKDKKGKKLGFFSKKALTRRKACPDSRANVMYKMKSANSKMFSSSSK
ncbi:circularly permutated Ras protein 1-like [Glandiceps talaboti]